MEAEGLGQGDSLLVAGINGAHTLISASWLVCDLSSGLEADLLPVPAHSVRLSTSGCVHAFFISCPPGNSLIMNVDNELSDVDYVLLGLPFDTSIYIRLPGILCNIHPGNFILFYFILCALDVEVKHIVSL